MRGEETRTIHPRGASTLVALALVVFGSGGASLMYQVAWTRRLATVTSATPAAQALVVGVFLAGLGLGAAWAGRRAPRLERPMLAYAAVELGAAACAALSVPAIGALGSGAPTWVAVPVSIVVLLATASLLGASLPFVLEHARQSAGADAALNHRMVGLLYGSNTLGAVSGALMAGIVTVERYGLRATTLLGCCVTLCAAAVGAAMGRKALGSSASRESASPPRRRATTAFERRLLGCAGLAGLSGVGSEIVYTRLLALIVQNTVYLFAEVLAGVLVGIAVGGFVASALAGRAQTSARALTATVVGLAVGAALIASAPSIVISLIGSETFDVGVATGDLAAGLAVFAIVAPPAAAVALGLPLLVAAWRASSTSEAFGSLYAANTAGSVAGSLLAGFVLLPSAGLAPAVSAMAFAAIAAGTALVIGEDAPLEPAHRRRALRGALAAAAVVVVLFHASRDVPRRIYEAHIPPGVAILDFREGTVSDAMVTQDDKGRRRLWINSAWVAGTGGGHEVLGHLPALFVPEPKRGLGIALGTGQTFAAMTRHGLSTLDCVEINPGVIALSQRWFGEANDHLFEQPGVRVHRDDGRAFLRNTDERYDLIVLEPLQAWTAGTVNLYAREFYEEARRALTPEGVVAQWIPFYGQTELDTRAMIRAGADVFPTASLWLNDNDGILLLSNTPFVLDPEGLDARMRARGVDTLLQQDGIGSASDLLALFLLGPDGIRRWTNDAPTIDDDHPFLEFSAARSFRNPNSKQIFASVHINVEEPARYLRAGTPNASSVARGARAVQQSLLAAGTLSYSDHAGRAMTLEPAFTDAPTSTLLSARYGREIEPWAHAKGNGSVTAAGIYQRALQHDPNQGEALIGLARIALEGGRVEDARPLLVRAKAVPRVSKEAVGLLDTSGGGGQE